MFGTVYGLPSGQLVPQSLRSHPVYPLLQQAEWPGSYAPSLEGLPRLYVGRARVEALTGRKFGPLDTRIDERSWWAFSPEEDLGYFIRHLEAFLGAVPNTLLTGVTFNGLDPVIAGPFTAEALWAQLLPGPAGKWVVLEHRFGWNWWDPATPGVVWGLQADAYYAHLGLARAKLREWFQASACEYVRDSRQRPVTEWFRNRFGYSLSDALRVAPWLMHLKARMAYLA